MNRLRWIPPLLLALAGCASQQHINPYTPKHRDYQLEAATQKNQAQSTPGSLWRDGSSGVLFSDARAMRENDLVVIRVEEIADARRSSETDLKHMSKQQLELQAFLKNASGVASKGMGAGLGGGNETDFSADGRTGRTERLTATVPAVVRKVLPNGNLFVEGHRVVLVNAEEQHFYISGVVRPIDIEQDNSVKSSMVADAEIEFTGQGALTDNQHQSAVGKFFSWLWPF